MPDQGGAFIWYELMTLDPEGAKAPVWSFYFRGLDIDAAATTIADGGGTMVQEPVEIPGGDFSLMATDPAGKMFGLVGARKG